MALQQDPKLADFAGLCRRNALHVVRLAWTTQPQIGFDDAGVRWLDRYIDSARDSLSPEMSDEFVHLMGCFYGECLVAVFGGRWEWSADRLGIKVDGLGFTYPFKAVEKQLAVGQRASISIAFATAVEHAQIAA